MDLNGKELEMVSDLSNLRGPDRQVFLRERRIAEKAKINEDGVIAISVDSNLCPLGSGRRELLWFLSKHARGRLELGRRFQHQNEATVNMIIRSARALFSGPWSSEWARSSMASTMRSKSSNTKAAAIRDPTLKPRNVTAKQWAKVRDELKDPEKEKLSITMKKVRANVQTVSHLGRTGVTGFKFRYETLTRKIPDFQKIQDAKTQSKGYEKADRVVSNVETKSRTVMYNARKDQDGVELSSDMLSSLLPHEYLTDDVITFYLSYLTRDEVQTSLSSSCYVASPFWYTKLANSLSYYNGSDTQKLSESLVSLRSWFNQTDVRAVRLFIIPVHGDLHWSLAICVRFPTTGHVNIFHLDSIKGCHKSKIVLKCLKRYFEMEWDFFFPTSSILPAKAIYTCQAKVPQQNNQSDCGLHMLHSAALIIDEFQRSGRVDAELFTTNWFSPDDASRLRTVINEIVGNLFH